MNILTLNTWGTSGPYKERWSYLFSELDKLNVDVFCFQEVFDETFAYEISRRYGIKFSAAFDVGLLIASRFKILRDETIRYRTKSPLEEYERGLLFATLELGNKRLAIGNTHWSWKPEDEITRMGQANELLERAEHLDHPVLLAGDFNDVPTSKPVQNILNRGFFDLYAQANPSSSAVTWDNRNPFMKYHSVTLPDRRIDLLLANSEFQNTWPTQTCNIVLNQPSVDGLFPSDHYGVLLHAD